MESRTKNSGDECLNTSLGKVNLQVKKMSGLINGFLNTSSFDAGKVFLNTEASELNDLLRETIADLKVNVLDHDIQLIFHADCIITADRDKIGQVINNLTSNAAKYSPAETTIEISFRAYKKTVSISVKDHGAGIKEEDQKKLFDRYYRADNIQTRKVSGFGLGLNLSAELVKLHNVKIWMESELGKGSRFSFSLPLKQV
ncbi:hypothetical protein D7004_01980 [Pedobacter jejuensis]|uniref:histidine kinase n=2 Tax=Pedobacter jejuensis TaxID=1268550 RepID=A0A3N0C2P1_9SPHI|nr:ATP-binding protein [Pedobacter jejuensis]RNL56022.1 hypothetical protein D7004_01980 [Pedobacter jejuensis]